MRAYPTLVDEGDAVGVRVVESREAQAIHMHAGTRRLLLLLLPSPAKAVVKQLTGRQQLVLAGAPYAGGAPALLDDATACAIDALLASAGGPVFDAMAFEGLRQRVGAGLLERTVGVVRDAAAALEAAARVQDALDALPIGGELQDARDDVNHQLGLLVNDGFLSATGASHVAALSRYLDGMVQRLGRVPTQVPVDRDRMHAIHALEDELAAAAEALGEGAAWPPHLTAAFWAIQELRLVQLSPGVRAEGGPSAKKVRRLIAGA